MHGPGVVKNERPFDECHTGELVYKNGCSTRAPIDTAASSRPRPTPSERTVYSNAGVVNNERPFDEYQSGQEGARAQERLIHKGSN